MPAIVDASNLRRPDTATPLTCGAELASIVNSYINQRAARMRMKKNDKPSDKEHVEQIASEYIKKRDDSNLLQIDQNDLEALLYQTEEVLDQLDNRKNQTYRLWGSVAGTIGGIVGAIAAGFAAYSLGANFSGIGTAAIFGGIGGGMLGGAVIGTQIAQWSQDRKLQTGLQKVIYNVESSIIHRQVNNVYLEAASSAIEDHDGLGVMNYLSDVEQSPLLTGMDTYIPSNTDPTSEKEKVAS